MSDKLINYLLKTKNSLYAYEDTKSLEYLFDLGYLFSKIENTLPKNKRISKEDFFSLINNEEFCKIITYIDEINNYYIEIKGKYSL